MSIFKVFRSTDHLVSKYTHDDQSETSIKVVPSKDTTLDAKVRINDREKYTVFISSSKGCYLNCSFCDLTIAKVPYSKLSKNDITKNIKDAIEEKISFSPEIKNRYIKLSWMGMGDALNIPQTVHTVSLEILRWVIEKGYAVGVDGVDLSTSFAKVGNNGWENKFGELNENLKAEFISNPNNSSDRSPFRLFYSLQSGFEATRSKLVPNTQPLEEVLSILKKAKLKGFQIIFHYVVLEGINDTVEQGEKLVSILEKYNFSGEEIRFLRYNKHPDSSFIESTRRFDFAKKVAENHSNIKLQISEGEEVRSACGQFMWGQN